MKELLAWVTLTARLLVDNPDALQVWTENQEGEPYIVLSYPPNPGQLIGREGQLAASIRRILKAAALNNGVGVVRVEVRVAK